MVISIATVLAQVVISGCVSSPPTIIVCTGSSWLGDRMVESVAGRTSEWGNSAITEAVGLPMISDSRHVYFTVATTYTPIDPVIDAIFNYAICQGEGESTDASFIAGTGIRSTPLIQTDCNGRAVPGININIRSIERWNVSANGDVHASFRLDESSPTLGYIIMMWDRATHQRVYRQFCGERVNFFGYELPCLQQAETVSVLNFSPILAGQSKEEIISASSEPLGDLFFVPSFPPSNVPCLLRSGISFDASGQISSYTPVYRQSASGSEPLQLLPSTALQLIHTTTQTRPAGSAMTISGSESPVGYRMAFSGSTIGFGTLGETRRAVFKYILPTGLTGDPTLKKVVIGPSVIDSSSTSFHNVSMNALGNVVYLSTTSSAEGAFGESVSFWGDDFFVPVVGTGDAVPSIYGGSREVAFLSFGNSGTVFLPFNDLNQIPLRIAVGTGAEGTQGIWMFTVGNNGVPEVDRIIESGQQAPGFVVNPDNPSATMLSGFGQPVTNARGEVVFLAKVGPPSAAFPKLVIYRASPDSGGYTIVPIVKTGDTLLDEDGRSITIREVDHAIGSGGDDGRPRSLNDWGDLAFGFSGFVTDAGGTQITVTGVAFQRGAACLSCDVNCDENVDLNDAQQLALFAVGLPADVCCSEANDINGDDSVDLTDAQILSQFVVTGLPTSTCP